MGTDRLSPPPGRSAPVALTVATEDGPQELVVHVGDDPDPGPALAAAAAAGGPDRPVVDRTGTPLRGAVAGRDLLPGDHLVAPDRRRRPTLVALTGPLAGAWATVDRELVLGRGGRFGSRTVEDHEVSRDHLRLRPTPGTLLAEDLGSTNGTLHDDRPLVAPTPLRSGDRLQLGGSGLVLVGDPPRRSHVRAADGHVLLAVADEHPPPRPALALPPTDAPTAGSGRWGHRRSRPAEPDPAETGPRLTELWERGETVAAWLRDRWPDPSHVAAAVAGWAPTLWSRHPDHPAHLSVRIGHGTVRLPVDRADGLRTGTRLAAAATHGDVPVTIDLRDQRRVGVVGPPELVAAHLAAWALHLAALQRPAQLALSIRPAPGSEALAPLVPGWRWLPHAAPAPTTDGGDRWAVELVEVGHRSAAELVELDARLGRDRTVVWVARHVDGLAPGCTTTVDLGSPGPGVAVTTGHDDGAAGPVAPDLLPPHVFDDLARLLAPLVAEPATAVVGDDVVDDGGPHHVAPAAGLPAARVGRRPGTP